MALAKHQFFPTADAFKRAVRDCSIEQHWEVKSIRSESKRILLGCRSTKDCPFRIKARCSMGRWRITVLHNEHTCIGAPAATRSSASHMEFLKREIPKLMIIQKNSTGQQLVDVMKSHHEHEISLRQAQRVLLELKTSNPAQQKKKRMEKRDDRGVSINEPVGLHNAAPWPPPETGVAEALQQNGNNHKASTGKPVRCGRCNGLGHNRRTCTVGATENVYAIWQPMEGNMNMPFQISD